MAVSEIVIFCPVGTDEGCLFTMLRSLVSLQLPVTDAFVPSELYVATHWYVPAICGAVPVGVNGPELYTLLPWSTGTVFVYTAFALVHVVGADPSLFGA